MSAPRREIFDARSMAPQASLVAPSKGELVEWEDWWTGGYIFEHDAMTVMPVIVG